MYVVNLIALTIIKDSAIHYAGRVETGSGRASWVGNGGPTTPLPKIESFLSEVLRLYPIAPFISRQNYEPVTLGDIHLDQHVCKLQHLSEISDK